MGRYAFFNTDFEYKFSFGVQPSDDIELFGGVVSKDYSEMDNRMEHTWTSKDKPFILEKLKKLEDINIDFEKYEKNLKGTQELRNDLYDIDIHCTTLLGCLIYHQLLYTADLICDYEVF